MDCNGFQDHLMGLIPDTLNRFKELEVIARLHHRKSSQVSRNRIQIPIWEPERQLFLHTGHHVASHTNKFPMMRGHWKEPSMRESVKESSLACLVKTGGLDLPISLLL